MERSRGWIIERRTHIYRGLAGGHVAVDGYGGKHCFVIAVGVGEKGMVGRIMGIVNYVVGDGHFEDVLEVDFWGRIRKMRVDRRDVGLDRKLRVVKGVRIGGLYGKGHGDRSCVVGERGGMVEGRVLWLCGCGGGEWTGERVRVVGERGPVEGGGRVDDGSGRGGRHGEARCDRPNEL
jgi:hypothetical protein